MTIPGPDNSLALDVQSLGRLRQTARQNSPLALKESARQFEALFLNTLLKSMRESSIASEPFSSPDSKLYTAMLDQQLSQSMAQRGVGLADFLVRQMTPALSVPSALPAQAPASAAPLSQSAVEPAPSRRARQTAPLGRSLARDFQATMGAAAQVAARKTGLPAAFILGQAALESGWGRRQIAAADGTPSFNLFGLKAGANWKGRVVEVATTEYKDGLAQKGIARFRAYGSYDQAFADYASMLSRNPRYRQVLANGQTVAGFAQGMQQAGYATDPAYAAKLARVIGRSLSA